MLPPNVFTCPISKLHSILAVANLLAHNKTIQICYCGEISLQSAAGKCSFSDNLTPLGVTFILIAMTHFCMKYYIYNARSDTKILGIISLSKSFSSFAVESAEAFNKGKGQIKYMIG